MKKINFTNLYKINKRDQNSIIKSFFTNFFQNYILPEKFNIDKRKAHLSSLISSNQITKSAAINKINEDLRVFKEDDENIDFFCSKLDLNKDIFHKIIKLPRANLDQFKNDQIIFEKFKVIAKFVKKISNKKI